MTRSITVMIQLLDTMRKSLGQSDIPLQQLLTFCHVADKSEMPMADLALLSGVTQSSVSRNVARLGMGITPKEAGFGLLEAYEDPYYRKRKLVALTPRGKELVKELERVAARYLKSAA